MSAVEMGTGLGDFLRARRELTTPEDVGLRRGERRRVAGLRRSEVAELAGISVDYYVRLEQGRDRQPSEQVLLSIARALKLNEHEMSYLLRLASMAPVMTTPVRVASPIRTEEDAVGGILASWPATPAFVADRNLDILESNSLARRLVGSALDPGENLVLQIFRRPSRDAESPWVDVAIRHLAALRFWSDPDDPRLQEILGILGTSAPEFPSLWARYDAYPLTNGEVQFPVEGAGLLRFRFVAFSVPGSVGTTLTAIFADEGSSEREVLRSLETA